jgi:hypothetical protein
MANTKKTDAEAVEIPKAAANDPGMQKVKAFYPNVPDTKYSGDITVGLNGVMYKVQRGKDVEIPLAVKEIIDNSYAEDQAVAERLAEAAKGLTGAPTMTM